MKNKIKEVRISKGITQEELANKSGISRPYISKLENGEELIIKNTTMIAIAAALGKSVNYIFFNNSKT